MMRNRRRSAATMTAAAAMTALGVVAGSVPAYAGTPVTWSFETMAAGTVPKDCATPAGNTNVLVSTARAHGGTHSMLMDDSSTTSIPATTCYAQGTKGVNLTMSLYPEKLSSGMTINLLGTTTHSATETQVLHALVSPDGSLKVYDTNGWHTIMPAGTIPLGTWTTLQLATTSDNRVVYAFVNGQYRTSLPWSQLYPVTSVTHWQVAGSGSGSAGDKAYVDDVTVADALTAPPAAVAKPFTFGARSTIATSTGIMQMPTAAVQVPNGTGTRILSLVPAHSDTSTTGGTQMYASTDGGTTWTSWQTHNPFPNAAGAMMTRLKDGRLMAVGYHGLAVPGQPNQERIQQAFSSDGGQTWTRSDGTLTFSEAAGAWDCEVGAMACAGLVMVHDIREDADGTMYQAAYGKLPGDVTSRQSLLVSKDRGKTWVHQGQVLPSSSKWSGNQLGFLGEGDVIRLGDGRLRMVMRQDSYLPMYTSTSSDNGKTWTTPTMMKDAGGMPVVSVYPTLQRAGDGSLIMLTGRQGYSVLRSTDDGATWSRQVFFDMQDSANGYLLPTGGQNFLVFGDTGANWMGPHDAAVWAQKVTVTP